MKESAAKMVIILIAVMTILTGCTQGILVPDVAVEEGSEKGRVGMWANHMYTNSVFVNLDGFSNPGSITQIKATYSNGGYSKWVPVSSSGFISAGYFQGGNYKLEAWSGSEYGVCNVWINKEIPPYMQ